MTVAKARRCLLGGVVCTLYLSHARWSYRRRLGSLLLCACSIWDSQLFERSNFPLFVDLSLAEQDHDNRSMILFVHQSTSLIKRYPAERQSECRCNTISCRTLLKHVDTMDFTRLQWVTILSPFFFFFFNTLLSQWDFVSWEIRVAFPKEFQLQQSGATQP